MGMGNGDPSVVHEHTVAEAIDNLYVYGSAVDGAQRVAIMINGQQFVFNDTNVDPYNIGRQLMAMAILQTVKEAAIETLMVRDDDQAPAVGLGNLLDSAIVDTFKELP